MLKLLFSILFAAACAHLHAQRKPFFEAYQFGLLLHHENYYPAPADWNGQFKESYTPPYIIDSMQRIRSSGWRILPGLLPGMVAGAQKYLGNIVGSKRPSRITWSTQLQFVAGRSMSSFYSNQTFRPADTVDYSEIITVLYQKRTKLNIYNSLDVRFKSLVFKRIDYNIGVGLMLGTDIRNRMNETISITRMRWNTQFRSFAGEPAVAAGKEGKGKNIRHISLVVPFGATWHITGNTAISLVHHYVRVWQNAGYKLINQPVEGYQMHLTLIYKPGKQQRTGNRQP